MKSVQASRSEPASLRSKATKHLQIVQFEC